MPADASERAPATVEFFEPPMCCASGLCGPAPDQTLLDLQETVRALESAGVRVARYQPGSHPAAFGQNPEVMRAIRERRMAALPLTLVNGVVILSGAYPTRAQVEAALAGGGR
jgi:hypothetical protein